MGAFPSAKAIVLYKYSVLCYLRDNKLGINDPNMWDIPGSDVRQGETYDDTIIRSCKEQINIVPKNIQFFKEVLNSNNKIVKVFIVFLNNDEYESIKLGNRGQELRFFLLDELQNVNLTEQVHKFFLNNLNEIKNYITIQNALPSL